MVSYVAGLPDQSINKTNCITRNLKFFLVPDHGTGEIEEQQLVFFFDFLVPDSNLGTNPMLRGLYS